MLDNKERYLQQLFRNHSATVKYKNKALEQVNPQLYEWLRTINSKASNDSIIDDAAKSKTENEQKQTWENTVETDQQTLVSNCSNVERSMIELAFWLWYNSFQRSFF